MKEFNVRYELGLENLQGEIWKDVIGGEGVYMISSLGRVKSLERVIIRSNGKKQFWRERILKQSPEGSGYLIVGLNLNKKQKIKKVHKLVAETFLNHKPDGTQKIVVDHVNNQKLDNRLKNLQLVSHRENLSKDKKGGSSKYTGVCWHKRYKKWISCITIDGKLKHLGYFTDEIKAAATYQATLSENLESKVK